MAAAAKMAGKHDRVIKGGAYITVDQNRPLRHAVEVRNHSFNTPAFVDLLRRHNVAVVVADTSGKWPLMEDVTSDFVYARLHGEEELYVSGYTDEAIDRWAKKVRAWLKGEEAPGAQHTGEKAKPRKAGRDVFVYFDNDVKVKAPRDARSLMARIGLPVPKSPTDGKKLEGERSRARCVADVKSGTSAHQPFPVSIQPQPRREWRLGRGGFVLLPIHDRRRDMPTKRDVFDAADLGIWISPDFPGVLALGQDDRPKQVIVRAVINDERRKALALRRLHRDRRIELQHALHEQLIGKGRTGEARDFSPRPENPSA